MCQSRNANSVNLKWTERQFFTLWHGKLKTTTQKYIGRPANGHKYSIAPFCKINMMLDTLQRSRRITATFGNKS